MKITETHNIIKLLGFQKKCLKCTKVPKMPHRGVGPYGPEAKIDVSLRSDVYFKAQSSPVATGNQLKINSVPCVLYLL